MPRFSMLPTNFVPATPVELFSAGGDWIDDGFGTITLPAAGVGALITQFAGFGTEFNLEDDGGATDFISLPAGFTVTSAYYVYGGVSGFAPTTVHAEMPYASPFPDFDDTRGVNAGENNTIVELEMAAATADSLHNEIGDMRLTFNSNGVGGGASGTNEFAIAQYYTIGSFSFDDGLPNGIYGTYEINPIVSHWFEKTDTITLPDGSTVEKQSYLQADEAPDEDWTDLGVSDPDFSWWCNDDFCFYQVDAPDPTFTTGFTPLDEGWWASQDAFGGQAILVRNSRPKTARLWDKLTNFPANAGAGLLGGSPSIVGVIKNRLLYPDDDYVFGTENPPIRVFSGVSDRRIVRVPGVPAIAELAAPTLFGTVQQAVASGSVNGTFTYVATAFNAIGETIASGEASGTVTSSEYALVTFTGIPAGASGVKIYRTAATGTPNTTGLIATVEPAEANFHDTGLAGDAASPPITNTTSRAAGISEAVMSMLVADGTTYVSVLDGDTGRVFELDLLTGILTQIGGEIAGCPYALAWHMGRLWVGTNNGDQSEGSVYWIRPNADESWTRDTESGDLTGGVTCMKSFQGLLYVGCDAPEDTFAELLQRDTDGTYTTVHTGTGPASAGDSTEGNAYLSLAVFKNKLYAGYWNDVTGNNRIFKSSDGESWSTAYTPSGDNFDGTAWVQLYPDLDYLFAIGGGPDRGANLVRTTDGATWEDVTAFLPPTILGTSSMPSMGTVVY